MLGKAGEKEEDGAITRRHREVSGMMDVFASLSVVMVLRYIYMPKLFKSYTLSIYSLLYINYSSITLFKQNV